MISNDRVACIEATLTFCSSMNIETYSKYGSVAQSDSYQNVVFVGYNVRKVRLKRQKPLFCRSKAPIISNLSTYNKHDFALKDTKNVETSGVNLP